MPGETALSATAEATNKPAKSANKPANADEAAAVPKATIDLILELINVSTATSKFKQEAIISYVVPCLVLKYSNNFSTSNINSSKLVFNLTKL